VLIDDISPHKKTRPSSQTTSHLVWVTDQTPADLSGTKDRAAIEIGIQPPRGGSVCRVVDFPPETEEMRKLDPHTMHASLGDGVPKRGLPPSHPAMHRTRTIDYAMCSPARSTCCRRQRIHLRRRHSGSTGHQPCLGHPAAACRIAFILINQKSRNFFPSPRVTGRGERRQDGAES
jgi:hypothetical protein